MSVEVTQVGTGTDGQGAPILVIEASGRDADGLLDMLPRAFEWSRDEATALSMTSLYHAANPELRTERTRSDLTDAERARRVALTAEALLRAAKKGGLLP